jgi:hypothetical protein
MEEGQSHPAQMVVSFLIVHSHMRVRDLGVRSSSTAQGRKGRGRGLRVREVRLGKGQLALM